MFNTNRNFKVQDTIALTLDPASIVFGCAVSVAGANAALQADTHPPLQSSCAATPAKLSITHLMQSDPIFALASTLHGAAFASPQPLPMQ